MSLSDLSATSDTVSSDTNFVGAAVGNNTDDLSQTSEVTDAGSVANITGNLEIDETTLDDIFEYDTSIFRHIKLYISNVHTNSTLSRYQSRINNV